MQTSLITSVEAPQPAVVRKGQVADAESGKEGEVPSFGEVFAEGEAELAALALNAEAENVEEALLEVPEPSVSEEDLLVADGEESEPEGGVLIEVAETETELVDTEIDDAEKAVIETETAKPNPVSLTESLVHLQTKDQSAKTPDVEGRAKSASEAVLMMPNSQSRTAARRSETAQTPHPQSVPVNTIIAQAKPEQTAVPLVEPDLSGANETRVSRAEQSALPTPLPQQNNTTPEPKVFSLDVLGSSRKETKLELTWPPAPEPRAQAVTTQTQVQIQPAQPLVAPVQTIGMADKEKATQFEPGRISSEAALGLQSGSDGPRESRQSVAAVANAVANIVSTRADLPVNVARQIADAAQRGPGQSVEVSLQPAELGRVRMTLSAAEGGITVLIQAERPETLDLMRRNIEALEAAIGDLGYDDVAFSFGDAGGQTDDSKSEDQSNSAPAITVTREEPAPAMQPTASAAVGSVVSLDVRV